MSGFKPGTVCSVRGSNDDWQVTGTILDGIVKKYVVQSRNTGAIRRVFSFELFEKYTSTYYDVDEFFKKVTGTGIEDKHEDYKDDFLNDDSDDAEMLALDISCDEQTIKPVLDQSTMSKPVDIQPPNKRFKSISQTDIQRLRAQNTERTTDTQTKWAVGLLKAWMSENDYSSERFEDMTPSRLDLILQQFYASLLSKKGGNYSKSALVGIRAGLNRYLTAPPWSRLLNIIQDRDIMVSNQVLTGLIKGLKRDGKDKSKHKEPITEPDQIKLYESGVFALDKPVTLQNKVLYEIIAQFGRRGREGLPSLKKDSFVIKTDSKERRYLTMGYNEADKTHHGVDSRERAKEPRMYAEPENEFCPLTSYEKYTSKLHPDCDRLFQRPHRNFQNANASSWFENMPLGINKLNNLMSRLSEEADLSMRYTNHCIRAFVSTQLQHKGFSNQSIMSVTGHRNVQSLNSYIKPHDDEKHSLSRALAYKSALPMVQPSAPAPCTASEHNQVANNSTSSSTVSTLNLSGREFNIFSGAVQAGTINVNLYNK